MDPWLLEHRTCPMCKMDILKHYGFVVGPRAQNASTVIEDFMRGNGQISNNPTNSDSSNNADENHLSDSAANSSNASVHPNSTDNSSSRNNNNSGNVSNSNSAHNVVCVENRQIIDV